MNFCESASSEYYYDYYYYREDRKRNSSGEDERSAEMADFNMPTTSLAVSGVQAKSWSNAPDLLLAESTDDDSVRVDEPTPEESSVFEEPLESAEASEPTSLPEPSPLPHHKVPVGHNGLGYKVPAIDLDEDTSSNMASRTSHKGGR